MATETKLEAIVLAAGFGSRFGGGKLTHPYGEGVLIDAALTAAFAAPVRQVTVITGADPAVEAIARAKGARTIHAADHADGLAASLRAGVESLPADTEGVFVFLGDMPRVPHRVLSRLAQALEGHDAAAPVFEGQRGHPVLFHNRLIPRLLALKGDQGAGNLLAALGDRLALVEAADDGILFDIDERPKPNP